MNISHFGGDNYWTKLSIQKAIDSKKPPPPRTKKEIERTNRNSNIALGIIFLIPLLISLFALKKIIFNKK